MRLSSLISGEVYWRVRHSRNAVTSQDTNAESRMELDSNLYSSPVLYADATGYCADNATRYSLYDAGTSDSASSGGSDLTPGINFNSATRARVRSAAISLPTSGHRLVVDQASSTANSTAASVFALVLFTGAAAAVGPPESPYKPISAQAVSLSRFPALARL